MPVSVDNVYQKVLALANKEQRGYVTPQEFNLLADRAQSQIFEGYFHDLKTAQIKPGNQTEQSDEQDMLAEKIAVHRDIMTTISPVYVDAGTNFVSTQTLPAGIHKLMSVHKYNAYEFNTGYQVGNDGSAAEITEVNQRDLLYILNHPYAAPTNARPVYARINENTIQVHPIPWRTPSSWSVDDPVQFTSYLDVIVKPATPAWGYVVVGEKALYNVNTSVDFDLHASEEEKLVTKILELAGIVINKPGLAQTAANMQQRATIEENN